MSNRQQPIIIINLTGGLVSSISSTNEDINVIVVDLDYYETDNIKNITTSKVPGHFEEEEQEYWFGRYVPDNIITNEQADQYLNFLKEQEKRIFDEE